MALLKRKKFKEHELERAAIAAEAARLSTPPKGHITSYQAPTRVKCCSCRPNRDKLKAVKPTRATHCC